MAHDALAAVLWQMIPQRRQDGAGADEVDADRGQVEGEVARHAMEAGGVAGHLGPVFVRAGADGAGRQGDGGGRAGVQVGGCVLGEEEGRVEADHAGRLEG